MNGATSLAVVLGLLVALVWIYYSAQIMMYGAEFTKVYANRYGTRIVPRRSRRVVPGRILRPPMWS